MAPSIQVYRLSLIWTDVELSPADPDAPLGKLRRRADYEAVIDKLRTANGHDAELRLPWWRKTPPHFFWLYYFGRLLPESVAGATAWLALAPLQKAAPLATLHAAGGVSGELRAYVAPQAVSMVADLKVTAGLTPVDWVEHCHALHKGELDVTIPGQAARRLRLQDAATEACDRVRGWLGQGPAAHALSEPFSLVTVVKADGLPVDTTPSRQVYQWAHAVAAWPAAWRQVAGDTARSIPLRKRDFAKSDLFYGTGRGRVLWMPSRALPQPAGRPVTTMSCYHHNIGLASMQVEMLLDFVRALQAAPNPVRLAWSSAGQRAAGLLGRLYGGTADIYRSASVRRQIDDSGLIGAIDSVRTLHNMTKLAVAA